MIATLIDDLLEGRTVTEGVVETAFETLFDEEVDRAQVAGLLVALRTRVRSASHLAALGRVMRSHQRPVVTEVRPLIDTCGTGGDGSQTFNISTAVGLVVAACGGVVAKHGNRSVSSLTGSADVLESLGVPLDLTPEETTRVLESCGFAFLFAPTFHPQMKRFMEVRKSLKVRTHFNLVGPLVNPACPRFQLLGVWSPELTEVVAGALSKLGSEAALVIHCAGTDELGLHDETRGHRLIDGAIEPFHLDPRDLGFDRVPLEELRGGEATENAEILRGLLGGEPGPRSDVVILNAGAALWNAGIANSIAEGVRAARDSLHGGAASRVLDRVCETSLRIRSERTPGSRSRGSSS